MDDSMFEENLADFHFGDQTDPLRAPREFGVWRAATKPFQELFQRQMLESCGPRTQVARAGRAERLINLASLDYLGLCRDATVIAAQQQALAEWGNGAAGVPLLSGTSAPHVQLEERLSQLHGTGGTLLNTSGFASAVGLASGLLHRGDVAICDQFAHISWMDGIRMTGAKLVTFEHNDPEDLDRVLTKHKGKRRLVIVDGLYSMDGDFADLPALLDACDAHEVGLIVDEAHSIFAAGAHGGGACERLGVQDRVRVTMGTFSKALSMVGGYLTADAELIDYLRYYSHPYVFSSALQPSVAVGAIAAMDVLARDPERRIRLEENAAYFRGQLNAIGLDTGNSESWVIPIMLGSHTRLLFESARSLWERGVYVAPIGFPAVQENALRLRTAVSANHTREDLDEALTLIEELVARPFKRLGAGKK